MSTTMTRTKSRRPSPTRKSRPAPARPVQELLLELAYRMHATRVVRVLPAAGH